MNFCIKHNIISKDIIQRCILITILFFLNFIAKSQEKKNFSYARPAMQGHPGFFLDDWKEKKNPKISIDDIEIKVDDEVTTFAITQRKSLIKDAINQNFKIYFW